MTLNDYQVLSKSTIADMGESLDLAHMVLGVVSELSELSDAAISGDIINIGEELADINWYLSNYCTLRKMNFSDIYLKAAFTDNPIEYNVSKWSDLVKKKIVYNKDIDPHEEYNLLRNIGFNMLELYNTFNLEVIPTLETNILKLKKRFPEKFVADLAINRNIEEERKELEKYEEFTD